MPGILKLALFCFGVAIVMNIWRRMLVRKACRKGAERIFRQVSEMFREEHEFRVTSRSDLPANQEAGYVEVERSLAERNFVPLGSIEDVTVSKVNPAHRTRIDCFGGPDGTTGASTFFLGGQQVTEFCTHFTDGRTLLTNNAVAGKLQQPPWVSRVVLPRETPLGAMLDLHAKRLEEWMAREPAARVDPLARLEHMLSLFRTSSARTSEYRRSIGYLTEEEIRGFTGGPGQEAVTRQVWREYRRLREQEKKAA